MSTEERITPTFPTWTFDKACPRMEWTPLSRVTLTLQPNVETVQDLASAAADLVVLPVLVDANNDNVETTDDKKQKELALEGLAAAVDETVTAGTLAQVLQEQSKALGKVAGTSPTTRVVANGKATRYALLAVGSVIKDSSSIDKDTSAAVGFSLGKSIVKLVAAEKKISTAMIVLPTTLTSNKKVMTDLVTAIYQSLYVDDRFRSKKKPTAEDLTSITLASPDAVCDSSVITIGQQIAAGVVMTKDIVNAPHNVLNSTSLAETAQRIALASTGGCVTCTILDAAACEARGMGAYLGVARGSETPPQFIHLTYKPTNGDIKRKVALVGKGVLFDTGGYNIKMQMMDLMKFDCGGAAAVLGAARAISLLCPPGVEAHFIVAACENMINDKAYVPSDVLTASNGLTIEIMNTDAEGRLTLADALVYADKEVGAEKIVEIATLTGACMVALGKQIAGIWSDNDDLVNEIQTASKNTGDKTWRMPMAHEYAEQLESPIADLKNLGARMGGAITAALFLQNFVEKGKPFCHCDIAGPVWEDGKGATGYGAKLLVEWVTQQGKA